MMGQVIAHYKIIEELGHGGMGVVYKAQDTRLNRFVALKFLSPQLTQNPEAKARFIREARMASSLDHPNICTIYEIGETGEGQLFISMAYYEGETLKQKIKNHPLPISKAIDIAIQISRGLARAHETGLVHRDIKPANILMTGDGTAKIVDFGIAKLEGQTRITKESSTPGTIVYLSPEQAGGEEADHRTDIWALGVILYEMLTRELPFKGDYDQVIIYAILHEQQKKITSISSAIPAELERIVDRALQKEAAKRYQNIEQMINDLKKVKQHLPLESSRQKVPSFFRHKMKKYSVFIGILMLLLISSLIFKPFIFTKKRVIEPLSIAVISFENQTGNPAYDYLQDAIPNLLITSLEQSPSLQVTTWERMYDLLKQAGKENIRNIDKDTGFEICTLDGINAIVSGSFVKAGDIFATDVKVLDISTKKLLKSARTQGTGIESILKYQIDQLSHDIASGIILPGKQVEHTHTNIMDVTTSSLEAYRYYLRGMDEYYRGTGEETKYFAKAVELDTTFATAYLWLGRLFNPNITLKNIYFIKAKQYSHRATKKEQIYIEAEVGTNDKEKILLFNRIIKQYPKEKYAHFRLAEHFAFHEDFESAIKEYLKALELDPDFVLAANSLCYLYAESGNYQEVEKYLQHLVSINPGDVLPMTTVANIYFVEGKLDDAIKKYNEASQIDPAAMSETYASIAYALKEDFDQAFEHINRYRAIEYPPYRDPGGRGWRSCLYLFTGQYKNALSDMKFAQSKFREWNNLYFLALIEAGFGSIYFEIQDYEKSRYHFTRYKQLLGGENHLQASEVMPSGYFHGSCLSFYGGENPQQASGIVPFTCEPLLGMVDIHQGYLDSARMRLDKKDKILAGAHTTTKEVINLHYQLLKAELLLAQDSIDAAITAGEEIKELALPRYFFTPDRILFYNYPWSRDILARAYIKKGDIDKAIKEYERLLHFNPAGKDRRVMNPKYHYYVAKLYQQKGQKDKAIQHLERFLEIWKNANKYIPDFIDAKKRLSTLINKP